MGVAGIVYWDMRLIWGLELPTTRGTFLGRVFIDKEHRIYPTFLILGVWGTTLGQGLVSNGPKPLGTLHGAPPHLPARKQYFPCYPADVAPTSLNQSFLVQWLHCSSL